MWFGFAGYFDHALHEDESRRTCLVDLLLDSRWPKPLRRATLTPRDLAKKERRQRSDRDSLIRDLTAPDLSMATLRAGAADVPVYARFDTGQRRLKRYAVGYEILLMAEEGSSSQASNAWIDLALEVARALAAVHGTLGVFDSADAALSDVTGVHRFLNDQELHPRPHEISQTEYWRPELGDQYVRHPRWGTLLAQKHVDAIGGRETITREVSPAAVRDVGNDTSFIQLTPIEDALSPVAEEKRQALARLMQPILVPEID